jgi:anti-sigma factor RsiW
MSDRSRPAVDHPDELLAGYVDGSATPGERAAVEAHLASCAQCREEAELASAGRTALASLPDLEAPGLARQGLASLRQSPVTLVPGGAERDADREPAADEPVRIPHGRRIAWVPALAAAAVVVIAGLIALPVLLRGGGGTASAPSKEGREATPTESPLPALVDQGTSYTPATLNALAQSLAPRAKEVLAATPVPHYAAESPAAGVPLASPTAAGRTAADSADYAASNAALVCLVTGGGLEADAVPVYLEEATFKGVPAYIGAFARTGARLNFVVVVVSRNGCQPLYSASQPA